ncbi:MAG: hypothetical protein H6744_10645 [Deltaproteobacteria bacterium]|nr:hypothetical protein [Deltaproteobacteria bacterium]
MRRLGHGLLGALLLLAACDGGGSGTPDSDAVAADAADAADAAGLDAAGLDAAGPDAIAPDAHADAEVGATGSTRWLYDPVAGTELWAFPDDYLTRPDPQSPTGLRLDSSVAHAPWVADIDPILRKSIDDLSLLSGFGTNGGGFLRFSAPLGDLPTGPDASISSDALMLLDLDTDPPTRVPFEATPNDDGLALVVWPLRPLRERARHALVATTALRDAAGGPLAPSPLVADLVAGAPPSPQFAPLVPRYQELATKTGLGADAIAAAVVFTTHGDLGRITAAIADVATRTYDWSQKPACTSTAELTSCEAAFIAQDYRHDGWVDGAAPDATWELKVSIWLPPPGAGAGPYPTLVYGHGINDSRGSGKSLARRVAPLGFAVVAADALEHGEHPTADPGDGSLNALRFLGIDLTNTRIDALALSGNFNQTMLDRLQMIALLKSAPDIDGDGAADIDATHLGYYGISLGGMMGSSLLAASSDLGVGVLAVAGGRLIAFVTDTGLVKPLLPLLGDIVGSEPLLERLLVVAQTVVDAADPATFAPHVLADRLVPGLPPNLLFPVAIGDETVPPAAGRALARALGIPQVPPVLVPVGVIPVTDAAPVSGDLPGGGTAGYFQLDRVTSGSSVVAATHGNTPYSPEVMLQASHFLDTWLASGVPEILDPYAELGTPALPPPAAPGGRGAR